MHLSLKRSMSNLQVKHEQIGMELATFRQELREDLDSLPKKLVRVLEYVQEHLFDPDLNVNTIKRQCRLRDNNFSMRFRSVLGVTPREYIEVLRMDAADRLLRSGEYEIYLVAMSVGYSHQETFFRAFQRHFGCPPSCRRSFSDHMETEKRSRQTVRAKWQEKTSIQR